MHTCHDVSIGGRVQLGSNIVFFLVFKDHLVIVDNYYRVAVSPFSLSGVPSIVFLAGSLILDHAI